MKFRSWVLHFQDPVLKWLSVYQCPICQALVVEDFMPDHLEWHSK